MGMIVAIFGVGANISIYRDENKNAADNGIFYGIILSMLIFSVIIFNSNKYINLMNMNNTIYKTFCIYSIFQILCHTIIQFIITKLYYKGENKKANKISIIFNSINFIVLISTAIITKNQLITALITGIVIFVMDIILWVKNIEEIDFKLNIKNCFKYNSVSFSVSLMFFIMYLFGFSNSFEYGEKYMIAIIFISLHILNFMLEPFIEIKICFLQLEDSSFKMTLNMIIAYIIRTSISFIPTPFCTIIGQMCSTTYELICTK